MPLFPLIQNIIYLKTCFQKKVAMHQMYWYAPKSDKRELLLLGIVECFDHFFCIRYCILILLNLLCKCFVIVNICAYLCSKNFTIWTLSHRFLYKINICCCKISLLKVDSENREQFTSAINTHTQKTVQTDQCYFTVH